MGFFIFYLICLLFQAHKMAGTLPKKNRTQYGCLPNFMLRKAAKLLVDIFPLNQGSTVKKNEGWLTNLVKNNNISSINPKELL